ncbi:nuclear condensing complex subunit [Sphaerosporella brunnea]|uniref:Nuclear condensing complex subunit n=1 Tax=Sphaerosporella brunnea TaxID=1250544 RepID=A0A5J5EQP9_9PEZI|nr:nuclear condensing complex subunit [Sphaerosporella brunnea]
MRGIFDQCLAGTGSIGSTISASGRAGEKIFTKDLCRFLNRVLVVKKSEVVGDRCLRLVDGFVKNLVEGNKKKKARPKEKEKDADGDVEMGEEEEEEEEIIDTSATRIVLRILKYVVGFLGSKERSVRYRTTQFLALLLVNSLPTFPFQSWKVALSIFRQLLADLTERLHDKEAIVRVQAAIGLVRLLDMGVTPASDAENSDDEEEPELVTILQEVMANDPSSDVRRTILHNMAATPTTLPYLLERSRDVDPATRRAVFNHLLPSIGDFRQLSIVMRERLLRYGLNDRDESVRKAARQMFNYKWIDDTEGDILEVLERLDITSEAIEGGPKYLALKGLWEHRKDVLNDIQFPDEFWDSLTPEGAFLARSFNDYCRNTSPQEAKNLDIDERMPEVTKLAQHLQRYLNKLVMLLREEDEDEAANVEFIVLQLLLIAQTMDYGDEIGRRRMFALMRECLSIVELSEPVTKLMVQGLRKLCTSESDFCLLILEAISAIQDSIIGEEEEEDIGDGEDSFHSARSEAREELDTITVTPIPQQVTRGEPTSKKQKIEPSKKRRRESDDEGEDADTMDFDGEEDEEAANLLKELTVNLRCLHIARCMLENVDGGLTSNAHLVTMLNGLVVPAVRSHDALVRERGLGCLGLCCLLDQTLAEENLVLFAHCFNKGHEKLQVEALQIISDLLLVHGSALFESDKRTIEQRHLYRMLAKATKMDGNEDVQATAVEVICKLMLGQVIKDEDLLKVLVTAYFDPATARNQSLRQTLSYFLPVFCHSAPANALMMANIAVTELHTLIVLRSSFDEGEDEDMVSLNTIAAHLVEWTDPRKTAPAAEKDWTTHAIVARDALERICVNGCTKDERKLLVTGLISKCCLSKDAGKDLLKEVYENVVQAIEAKVIKEALGKNALSKVEVTVGKLLAEIQQEEGGDETVLPAADGDEEEGGEEEEEEEDVDMTVIPEKAAEEPEAEVEPEPEDDDRTPVVTEAEDEDDDE